MTVPLTLPRLTVRVYGTPVPQGSKRIGRTGGRVCRACGQHSGRPILLDANDAVLKPWRALVEGAARQALGLRQPLTGALILGPTFYLPRPPSHYTKAGRRKKAAPVYPEYKPDLSKLIRAVEDSLSDAGVWTDDARVVAYHQPSKVWAQDHDREPGALLQVWSVEDMKP